jgi:hypothetical protein
MTIDEARAQLADIDQTCRIAHLADLRDGETIDFYVSTPAFGSFVVVYASRPVPDGFATYRAPTGERLIEHRRKALPIADIGRHPLFQMLGPVGFVAAIAAELLSEWRAGERRRDLLSAADFVRGRS